MSMVIHLAEIAALLALSYAIGLAFGYGARRIALGATGSVVPAIPPERLAAAKGEVPSNAETAPPEAVVALAGALAAPEPLHPNLEAAAATDTPQAAIISATELPLVPNVPVATAPAEAPRTEEAVLPPPASMLQTKEPTVPQVAAEGQLLAALEAAAAPGHEPAPEYDEAATAQQPEIEPAPPAPESVAELRWPGENLAPPPQETEVPPPPVAPSPPPEGWAVAARRADGEPGTTTRPPPHIAGVAAPASRPGVAWSGEIRGRAAPPSDTPIEVPDLASEPVVETVAVQSDPTSLAVVEPQQPSQPGEWGTRSRTAAADVGQAVAAAQSAVEAALARSGIDPAAVDARDTAAFGKPSPVKPSRAGRDDLRMIEGLRAEDEVMLNGIGIFTFDQIAAWDQKEILWLENHILERGRVARENWQTQATRLIQRRLADAESAGS